MNLFEKISKNILENIHNEVNKNMLKMKKQENELIVLKEVKIKEKKEVKKLEN
jgi:hypothetical protein